MANDKEGLEAAVERLEPCPFCGGPAYAREEPVPKAGCKAMATGRCAVAPRVMGATLAEAIVLWNTRSAAHLPRPVDGDAITKDCWAAIGEWIGFSASVIKSGEPWTATCEDRFQKARQGLARLKDTRPTPNGWR